MTDDASQPPSFWPAVVTGRVGRLGTFGGAFAYGVLNVSAVIEALLKGPSFRPQFKVHWGCSALGCISVMFLINVMATVATILVVVGISVWLERRNLKGTWGDVRRGLWLAITRAGLMHLNGDTDPRSWHPHVLMPTGAPMLYGLGSLVPPGNPRKQRRNRKPRRVLRRGGSVSSRP